MGVCCVVFEIDGMLFEFFLNFWNIEKFFFLRILFLNISSFLHVLCYLQQFKTKFGVKIISGGGGGGGGCQIFSF